MLDRERYVFYTDNKRKVVAVSSYAQKPVRGVAVCADEDKFNLLTGAELAAARCNLKVANKRKARAQKKYDEALLAYQKAKQELDRMTAYFNDAEDAAVYAENRLCDVEGLLM